MSSATITTFEQLTPFRKWMLRHADSNYVAARLVYYTNSCYPVVPFLCREALEKYLKLLLLQLSDIPDNKADATLRQCGHQLTNILQACQDAATAVQEGRSRMLLSDQQLINNVRSIDHQRYEMVARYPHPFPLSGNIVQTFDSMISCIRDFYLDMKGTDPLEIVFRYVGPMEGWPNVNRALVTEAFHYQNGRYSQAGT